jgi:hypothetical protein
MNKDSRGGGPFLGLFMATWPSWELYKTGTYNPARISQRFRTTRKFEPSGNRALSYYWTIQIVYFENISQSSFWDSYVTTYGDELFKPARLLGLRKARGEVIQKVVGQEYLNWLDQTGQPRPQSEIPMNASEAAIWMQEQRRITRAAVIKLAMTDNREAKE